MNCFGKNSRNELNMKKIYYEKIGRRYIPVKEYDSDLLSAFPKGNHLVMSYPGGRSTVFNIDPNYAAMIAAGRVAQDTMTKVVQEASEISREENTENPLTPEQKAAWEHLVELFGERARYLHWPSARDVVDAGLKAMQHEADRLMKHPSVKNAYEHFLLVAELTKDENTG